MLPKASKSLVVEEGMEVPDISHGLQSVVLPYPVQVSVVIWHSCSRCPHLAATCSDWNEEE